MNLRSNLRHSLLPIAALTCCLLLLPTIVQARYIGAKDPESNGPVKVKDGDKDGGGPPPTVPSTKKDSNPPKAACKRSEKGRPPPNFKDADAAISLTEGNLQERYWISSVSCSTGLTLNFYVTYNSYNADGSRVQVDTVMGYGWTHSYNTTVLTYTAGNLTGITDTYGRSLALTYNGQKKLASLTDPLGRTTTFTYDSTGRKFSTITDPLGKKVQYSYNFLYQMIQKTDKDGRVFTYQYASNKPVAVRDGANAAFFSLSNPTNWATDATALARDQLVVYLPSTTTETDGRGNVWKYDYDAHSYITKMIAPDGATTRYTYDPATLMVASIIDANIHTTSYEYDSQGNRTRVTDARGNVSTFTYKPTFNMMTSMTDPKGRVTTFDYDTRGNRIREIDPLLQTKQWSYDTHGNILTETDKRGNVTTHIYDAQGNRIQTTDALGNVTTMTYDTTGNMLSLTDANGHTVTFVYDSMDRIIRVTDPVGKVTQIFYDGEGNRIQAIDRNGHNMTFQYDVRQRLVKTTDALNQMVTNTYDGNDNHTSMTDKNAHPTTFAYDVQNRLTRITDAVTNTTVLVYDAVGNIVSSTDANAHVSTYAYDELDRLTTVTDAEGNVTQFAYDMGALGGCGACGATPGSRLITKQTDGNGKVIYFKYDELDRLSKVVRKEGNINDVIDASDAVTTFTYDPNDNRVSMTEPNGNTTTYEYDALNRRTKKTNAAGDVMRWSYDGVGNIITTTAPNGNVTTYAYDARDRLIQLDDSIGSVATYTYDAVGNLLSRTDGNVHTTTYTYDALNRLIKVTDPLGEMTIAQYNPVGNVLKVTDREGNMTTHGYDDIDRRTSTTDALGHTTQFQYDGVGNLLKITDANAHATQYEYDNINRLVKETYADPAPNMRTFTYDAVGNRLSRTDQKGQTTTYTYNDLYFLLKRDYPTSPADHMTYDLSGRMLTAERGGWLVTFTYDGADRVTRTTQNGETIDYVYNIPGRTLQIVYPGGRGITQQMDFRDRLNRINDPALIPSAIAQYTYDLGDRTGSRTYRNGAVASYTYDANDRVLSLEHTLGMTRIVSFGHDYDKEGNKKFEEKRHATGRSEAYQYDSIYRLIDYKVGTLVGSTVPLPVTQTAYNLDPVSNWNSKTTDGVTQTRRHNEVNELTKIDATNLRYDDNGNLIDDGTYTYAYDEENRLTQVTRKPDLAVVGEYQYDALSRRVVKVVDPAGAATQTRYFYHGWRVIEEQDATGVTQATYVYGNYVDKVLTMDRSGQTYYYHQNTLFSVSAITDSNGAIVEAYQYDAYGKHTVITDGDDSDTVVNFNANDVRTVGGNSTLGNPRTYGGYRFDPETGLHHVNHRYFSPELGRWLARDLIGYRGGMNLYSYVRNRPTLLLDPLGLDFEFDGSDTFPKDVKAALERLKKVDKLIERIIEQLEKDPTFKLKFIMPRSDDPLDKQLVTDLLGPRAHSAEEGKQTVVTEGDRETRRQGKGAATATITMVDLDPHKADEEIAAGEHLYDVTLWHELVHVWRARLGIELNRRYVYKCREGKIRWEEIITVQWENLLRSKLKNVRKREKYGEVPLPKEPSRPPGEGPKDPLPGDDPSGWIAPPKLEPAKPRVPDD